MRACGQEIARKAGLIEISTPASRYLMSLPIPIALKEPKFSRSWIRKLVARYKAAKKVKSAKNKNVMDA